MRKMWLILFAVLFAATIYAGDKRFVIATSVNLREQQRPDAKIIGKLPIATEVEIEKTDKEWVLVVVQSGAGKGKRGWLASEFLVNERPTIETILTKSTDTPETSVETRRQWAERAVALDPSNHEALKSLLHASLTTSTAADHRCPKAIIMYGACDLFFELQLSEEYPALFSRNGPTLRVRLADGTEKIFVDVRDQNKSVNDIKGYNFVQYYPDIGYAVIKIGFWEGYTHILLNMRTGEETEIVGDAVPSPNKKRIAVRNADIGAGYTSNVLTVYQVQTEGLTVEFEEAWPVGDLHWINDEEISFTWVSWKSDKVHEEIKKLRYRGVNKNGERAWVVE